MTWQAILAASAVFKGLTPALLDLLLERGECRTVVDQTSLFAAATPYKEEIYIVLDGTVQVRRPDGKTYVVETGDFAGLSSFLDRAPYSSTAVAIGDVTLLVLSEVCFQSVKAEYPALSTAVNRSLASRLRRWAPQWRGHSTDLVQKVRTVMAAPFVACSEATTLYEARTLMRSRKVGTLGVVAADGRLLGQVTPAVIADQLLLECARPETRLADIGLEPLHVVDPDSPLWRAEQLLLDHGAKHLAVLEAGEPVGMLAQSDIVRLLFVNAQRNLLSGRAGEAVGFDELRTLKSEVDACARAALEGSRRAISAVQVLSDAHLALNRRCVELTLKQLREAGEGEAPASFAVLVMGSGGRREMLLAPDQDNGLIIDDTVADDPEALKWFNRFGRQLNQNLADIGYPLCPGEVMAGNQMFAKPLGAWKEQISYIAEFPSDKAARWGNVVFDFATLYGEERLTAELRRHLGSVLVDRPRLLARMVEDDAEGRAPIGLFNRLVTSGGGNRKGCIDLKRNGLRLVADAARIYALRSGVQACGTVERLTALVRLGQLDADLADSVVSAYDELIAMLLERQLEQRAHGEAAGASIEAATLTPYQRELLRDAMLAVKRLQDQLQGDFARLVF